MPAHVIEAPETITVAQIDAEQNTEVRRVMIERYKRGGAISGAAAFLLDSGAQVIDHDPEHGRLLRRAVPNDEPITMVQVLNPTAEPDGHLDEATARETFGDVAVAAVVARWPDAPLYQAGIPPKFKTYFLRVAPDLRPMKGGGFVGPAQELTARNAVASTWGLTGAELDFNIRA